MKSKDFALIRSPPKHKCVYVPLQTVDKQQIVIKSSNRSPRLEYVLDFIFNHFFDCGYQIALNSDDQPIHIIYGQAVDGISIYQSGYLFGEELMPNRAHLDFNEPNFDLFAFVFFQLSRAEEYNYTSQDQFGRFPSTATKFTENLSKPIVDILLLDLADKLKAKYHIDLKRKEKFRLIHTVDVDQIFAYKGKNLKRSLGGLVSNVLKADLARLKDRKKSMMEGSDPYDSFGILQKGAEGAEAHYFILVGDYNQVDNALELEKEDVKSKIFELTQMAEVGIHPSVESNKNIEKLRSEIDRLENVLSAKIKSARQHYLCINFPKTYRSLIDHGIENDFSLGFHDHVGFRAGTTNSYCWFDLENNLATDLLIHPLIAMDVSLKKYMALSPSDALDAVKKLIDACKSVQGPFCLLWHNSSFYKEEGWEGWEETYWGIVNYCKELNA